MEAAAAAAELAEGSSVSVIIRCGAMGAYGMGDKKGFWVDAY